MRIIATTVLLAASVTAGALHLKGVSPGQPWEPQVIQDTLNVNGPDPSDPVNRVMIVHCDNRNCRGSALFGNCYGRVEVTSRDGMMIDTISVGISVDCYDATVALMMEKFGPTSHTLTQGKQNAFGAKFDDVTLIWSSGDQTLLYEKYWSIDQSLIALRGPQKPEKKGTL